MDCNSLPLAQNLKAHLCPKELTVFRARFRRKTKVRARSISAPDAVPSHILWQVSRLSGTPTSLEEKQRTKH